MSLTDNFIPCKRPHFELRNREIFFLLSTRPCAVFDDVDVSIWTAIDGITSVQNLCSLAPDAVARLERMHQLELCELIPPSSSNSRRRVLVFEPHMDDAALSVGGTMWAMRDEAKFTLVSVAARSNFTSYYFLDREYFDADAITELRRQESALVMRLLGGTHAMLQEADAPLRYQPGNWTLEWFRHNHRCINARLDHCSPDAEITAWASAIADMLRTTDADEIWMPLGVGGHTDHELTRNACLRALSDVPDIGERCKIFFYQDVPYATQYPEHTRQILAAMSAAGGVLERIEQDIGAAFSGKLRLNSIYGSQFKLSYMAPKLEACAIAASQNQNGRSEVLYRVEQLPGEIAPLQLYSSKTAVEALRTQLTPWMQRHRLAKHIRILSLVGFGCWADDMKVLLDTFPEASFDVYLSDASAEEARRFTSVRIKVHIVEGRGSAWFGLLARLALSWPYPTIAMTGAARVRLMPIIRAACLLCDPLPAVTVNLLVQAIRREDELSG